MIGRVARVGYGYPRRLMSADLVFVNGPVFTSDAARSFARAVAVGGDRILAVGDEGDISEHIGTHTEVIDLAGRLLTPGFQDAHVHPGSSGLDLLRCSLSAARDAFDALGAVARYATERPSEPWILGGDGPRIGSQAVALPRSCSTQSSPIAQCFSTTVMGTGPG